MYYSGGDTMTARETRLLLLLLFFVAFPSVIGLLGNRHLSTLGATLPWLGREPGQAASIVAVAVMLCGAGVVVLSEKLASTALTWTIGALILLIVILPTLGMTALRFATPDATLLEVAHDGGVVQTELSARLLLEGRNPYSHNFKSSPLINVGALGILVHNPYPPLTFILPAPLIAAFDAAGIEYDQRYLHLVCHLASLMALAALFERKFLRRAAVILFALNPLMIDGFQKGMNDIYVISTILVAFAALKKTRPLAFFAALAFAASLKQFAWFLLPFFFLHSFRTMSRADFARGCALFAVIVAAVYLPFLAWSPRDLIDDLILFNSGGSELNYPFGGTPGLGLSMLLAARGWVLDLNAPFPNGVLMAAFGLPVLALCLYRLHRNPTLSNLATGGFLFTFISFFMARLFHTNYVALLSILLMIGVFLEWDSSGASARLDDDSRRPDDVVDARLNRG